MKVRKMDSLILADRAAGSLNEVLAWHSPLNFKEYGVSGFSIPVFRGAGGSHTKITWSGLGINSGMNGQLDFSSLGVGAIQSVEVISGGNSAVLGNGGFGGTIQLESEPVFQRGLSIDLTQEAGSFGKSGTALSAKAGNEKFQSHTVLMGGTAKNDFQIGNTGIKQQNAHRDKYSLLQEFFLKTRKGEWSARSWYSMDDKELQAPLGNPASLTALKNEAFRNMVAWKMDHKQMTYKLQAARLYEKIIYTDQLFGLVETSITSSNMLKGEAAWKASSALHFYAGTEYTYEQAADDPFLIKHDRQFASAWAGTEWNPLSWLRSQAAVRAFLAGQYNVPLAYSLGIRADLFHGLYIRAFFSRNYHLPSMNDLYWRLGGNQDLEAEKGYHVETGLHYDRKHSLMNFSAEATLYRSLITDWIQWSPGVNGIWSPSNLKEVELKGVEASADLALKTSDRGIGLVFLQAYSLSLNRKAILPGDASVGKQLIYIPLEYMKVSSYGFYGPFRLAYAQQFNGYKYITSDNTRYIPGYIIGRISLNYRFSIRKLPFQALFHVENVWNTHYQTLPDYAMPGRHYLIQLILTFNKRS